MSKTKAPGRKKKTKPKGKKRKPWSIYDYGVSVSLLEKFLTCREQFRLTYMEGWRPKEETEGLMFGDIIHRILEHGYALGKPPRLPKVRKITEQYENQWHQKHKGADPRQVEMLEKCLGLAEVITPIYFDYYKQDFKIRWLFREKSFRTPYVFPEKGSYVSTQDMSNQEDKQLSYLNGYIDGAFIRKKGLWLFETKALSKINEDEIIATLPYNLQVMLYLYVLPLLCPGMDPPKGVYYNIIRRPGTYRRKEEPLKDYCRRVAEEVFKDREHYFIRIPMEITEKEVFDWSQEQLGPIMLDLRNYVEGRTEHYMNPLQLITKYGKCQLFDLMTRKDYSRVRRA